MVVLIAQNMRLDVLNETQKPSSLQNIYFFFVIKKTSSTYLCLGAHFWVIFTVFLDFSETNFRLNLPRDQSVKIIKPVIGSSPMLKLERGKICIYSNI